MRTKHAAIWQPRKCDLLSITLRTEVLPLGGPGGTRVHDGEQRLEVGRGAVGDAFPVALHTEEAAILAAAAHELWGKGVKQS